MLGSIVYKAYYGSFDDYNSHNALLFYTNIGGNVKSVEVLNEPTLEWELSKAGSITFKLSPSNAGYAVIKCKQKHIFIEKNSELIWHGRVIEDTFDIDKNREILCEGALNYLVDTHVSPRNSAYYSMDLEDIFNSIIDEHNQSLQGATSLIFGRRGWHLYSLENNIGGIANYDDRINFTASGATNWNLFVWSNPSIWKYSDHKNSKIHVSFDLDLTSSNSNDFIYYGVHLRDSQEAPRVSPYSHRPVYNGYSVYSSGHYERTFTLGPGGLDGTSYPDYYIGFQISFNASAGAKATIKNIKVERINDVAVSFEKTFSAREGLRTGINRAPESRVQVVKPYELEDTGFPTTLDLLNDMFVNKYGGYIYVGYNKDEHQNVYPVINYIYGTYFEDGINDDVPLICYGKNLVDCKITNNYEDLPTVIIPIGSAPEEYERAYPVSNITYQTGRTIDKNGLIYSDQPASNMVAQCPVKSKEVYYVSGTGKKDAGLYSIRDSDFNVIDHGTFNSDDENEYSQYLHTEIEIPEGGVTLVVYFYNSNQVNPPTSNIFEILKYNTEDRQENVTLENYIGDRLSTDPFVGTKYLPMEEWSMDRINTYGWIEQIVEFDGITNPGALLARGRRYAAWLEDISTTYEAEAVDLSPIRNTSENYSMGTPGSYGEIIIPELEVDKELCVTKCTLNLQDTSKSRYSLGTTPPPNLSDLIAKGIIDDRF